MNYADIIEEQLNELDSASIAEWAASFSTTNGTVVKMHNIQDYKKAIKLTSIRFRNSGKMYVYYCPEFDKLCLVHAKTGYIAEIQDIAGLNWKTI